MHGDGTYTWADGSTYVGTYRNGAQFGEGIFTDTEGSEGEKGAQYKRKQTAWEKK